MGVDMIRAQSNVKPDCTSTMCRTSSENGTRPTLTWGGVRNQNSRRGRALPPRWSRPPAGGSIRKKFS